MFFKSQYILGLKSKFYKVLWQFRIIKHFQFIKQIGQFIFLIRTFANTQVDIFALCQKAEPTTLGGGRTNGSG